MRGTDDIQSKHDLLVAVVLGELPELNLSPEIVDHIRIALDTICWVLEHEHNNAFMENFANLEKEIKDKYQAVELPRLMNTDEIERFRREHGV